MMRSISITFALLLLCSGMALAQAPDADPSLPEITPREIEIRGEYRVVFPSLERPTLQELQPRTRVQALPLEGLPSASRIAFRVDALPSIPLDPPSTDPRGLAPIPALLDGTNGFLEAAGGRFTERRVATELQFPVGPRTHLRISGDYEGMQGATPFEERNARTAYDDVDAAIDLSHRGSSWSWQGTVDGTYQQYDLYGFQGASQATAPERITSRLGTAHTLRIHQGLPLTWTIGYDVHETETNAVGFTTQRLSSDLDLTVPIPSFELALRGNAMLAGHNGNDAFSGDSSHGTLHGIVQLISTPELRVEGGVSVMSAATNRSSLDPDMPDSNTYGAPYALIEWRPTAEWMLYAEQTPSITLHTPLDLFDTNPYATPIPALGTTAHTLNATAGAAWSPGPLHVDVYGGVQHSPIRQFFEQNPSTLLFTTLYRESTTWNVGVDATFQALDPWFGTIEFVYTEGSLERAEGLPLVAKATGEATVGYRFPNRQARIQMHLRGQGPRDLNQEGTQSTNGFVGLGLSGDVQLTPNIELTGYVQDVGSNDMMEWPGHPRPTARVGGGVRLLW